MTHSEEERLKIAVFIDFDNISIGVKQSLNRNFDVGTVLEAIKEKGQVVTKIAYGDWKRHEDFSKAMTQHAVQMVQRNLTPGGDKNGADIALALDALEMAFTRDHINAFVIVGGDSDFIALVEKLKQYDKVVFIVGGRAFTSVILQKNCHEFISYENLIGVQSSARRSSGSKQPAPASAAPLDQALPLIRRSLKILSDREVSPQLGLLKSTLLQLDSTFSERDYGVSSFRDFTQKLAAAGYVNLKHVDRSLLVELKDVPEAGPVAPPAAPAEPKGLAQPAASPAAEPLPAGQPSDAIRSLQEILRESKAKPHWPMYLRSFKQFLKSLQPPFDERPFGITSTYDLVRQAQKDGLLHVERNRQGILRLFPGELFPHTAGEEAEGLTQEAKEETAAGTPEPPEPEVPPTAEPETGTSETEAPEPKGRPGRRTRASRSARSGRSPRAGSPEAEARKPEPEAVLPAGDGAEFTAPEKPGEPEEQPLAAPFEDTPPPTPEEEQAVKKPAAKRGRKTGASKTARSRKPAAKKKPKDAGPDTTEAGEA